MGRPVFVREDPLPVGIEHGLDVVRRIEAFASAAIANFEIHHVSIGTVHQLMRNARGRKSRAHAGTENRFAGVRDQCRFALQYINEFILLAVTMQKGRLSSRQQPREIYAEVLEPESLRA
jgi:hypothetical protein